VNPVLGQSLQSVLIRTAVGVNHKPRAFQSEDLIHDECLVLVNPTTEFAFNLHHIHSLIPHCLCTFQELVNPVLCIAIFYPGCALLF